MTDLAFPEVPEIEEFFTRIRDPQSMLVDGYYRVKRKDLPVYSGGIDNVESIEQVDLKNDTSGAMETDPDTRRVYYLHYKNQVPQSIVDLAFDDIPTLIDRIIFKVSRNLDVLIDRAGNLIFLKNRTRGFILQELVTHLLKRSSTYRLPGEGFKELFANFEEVGKVLFAKLSTDKNVVQYYQTLLTEK